MKEENCSLKMIYTCDALDVRNHIQVGTFRYQLGNFLGEEIKGILPKLNYIVPVPNAGLYYAMGLSASIGVPYFQGIVKQNEGLRSMRLDDDLKRKKEIESNMVLIPSVLEGKCIALVDEAVFSGVTLKILAKTLRENGVKEIHLCIPTIPCVNTCEHLPQRNLIAVSMNHNEMCSYLNADSLHFLSPGRFCQQMQKYGDLCTKCFLK